MSRRSTRPSRTSLTLRLALGLVISLAALASLAGCASSPSDDTYHIGALFAVTGFNSPLGTPEKETVLMLEEQINARGGINGRKLKVTVLDTESDETKAVTLAKRLIETEKVLAIIGPSSTGESLAVVDTVERSKVPLISAAASARITTPVKPWVFKTPQSDALAAAEIFAYCKAKGIQRVAILASSGGFGVTGREAIEKVAPDYSIQIVAAESFGDKDTDMTVQLTKLKGSNAQAIIVWGTNPGPAIISKNARQLGIDLPIFQSHGIANRKFIELAGDAANNVVFPAGRLLIADGLPESDPQRAVLQAYARDFQAKYNKPADTFGGHAYDAMMMVVQAIEKGGEDRAAIRDGLEGLTGFVGTGGVFNMSKDDHNGLGKGAFVMIRIVDGKWELEKAP